METKDTLLRDLIRKEQQNQLIQDKAKESCQFQYVHYFNGLLDDEYVDMKRTNSYNTLDSKFLEFPVTTLTKTWNLLRSVRLNERAKHKPRVDSWENDRRQISAQQRIEVQTTVEINIFATGQQHTERPEFNNEGKVDQNVEQCHDTCPLPAKFTDNQITELSNQSLESENIHLKKTVAQFQKDFSRMEAHCVNLELKYQVLKEGQHGQFSKVKSNEAKVKHDTDVIETINIELEHKVAQLLEENETLKRHNKEMFDSIKTIRAKNIEHTASLIANNDKFKTKLQEKAFTSERPDLFNSNGFASQVDVNNDLSKPALHSNCLRKRIMLFANPHHLIAPGSLVGLRWVPTGKIFTSSTTKVDSEPQNGSNEDITNQYECEQTLDVSAGTLNLSAAFETFRNEKTSMHESNTSVLERPLALTGNPVKELFESTYHMYII
ncbi:hypothetical protein Tco_0639154 [Tanacetum coccineum]